jgi:predicted lipoprotein with Yx(FWY)xxD motif
MLPTAAPTATPPPTIAPLPTVAATAPPSPTTVTTTNAFPTGIFANAVGWAWEFIDDGRQSFQMPGVSAWGTYAVSGNKIVFKESSATCGPDAKEGTYTWAYDGKVLSFKVLDDRCGGREGSATSSPWVKKTATTEPVQTVVPTVPPSPTSATMASAYPTGTFANPVGWTWEFAADGRQAFHANSDSLGDNYVSGTYTVTGNQVVFSDSSSTWGLCVGDAKEGAYTWAYDGKALSFKVLNDRCGFREGAATSGPWVKQP